MTDSDPARWAICPTNGRTHSLLLVGHPPGMLRARCGHPLPLCVVQDGCLPSRLLCVTCMWGYLVPPPVFIRQPPADHRPNRPLARPAGQPGSDPTGCAADLALPDHGLPPVTGDPRPRWARYPLDQHLQLLTPEEVAATITQGYGRAMCGRSIHAGALTWDGSSAGFCQDCLAAGTAP